MGYTIRFDDKSSSETEIKYVTDGILVRECLMDADLLDYSVVVLDEVHERSLDTDILFSLVKRAVMRRKGTLRLVITSATLGDKAASMIKDYYFNCPMLSVSGRCFDVSILFKESKKEKCIDNSVDAAIRIHLHEPAGDILVFLTGFEECEHARRQCFKKI